MTTPTPSGLPQPQTVAALREALRIAILKNTHDLLMTGEEIRQCKAALSAPAVETVAVQEAQKLAELGWQSIECDICGSSARAFPVAPKAEPTKVFLVCTGEVYEGQETYTRHEGAPPLMSDFETLYTTPQADSAQPVGADTLTDAQIIAAARTAKAAHWNLTDEGCLLIGRAVLALASTPRAPVGADTLTDLAHSAYEEAMQFGLSHDLFLRYFRTLASPPRAIPATPAQVQPAESCYCDRNNLGNPGVSCGDCPARDYKQPAEQVGDVRKTWWFKELEEFWESSPLAITAAVKMALKFALASSAQQQPVSAEAKEVERLKDLADSEGTRAVNYLRRARKAESLLRQYVDRYPSARSGYPEMYAQAISALTHPAGTGR